MAGRVNRGEVRLHTFRSPDKRRPVLVLSRQSALQWIDTAMVAPITSSIRGLASEVRVGTEEGLKHESAVNLDHVQTVNQRQIGRFLGTLSPDKMTEVCKALAVAVGCDSATGGRGSDIGSAGRPWRR